MCVALLHMQSHRPSDCAAQPWPALRGGTLTSDGCSSLQGTDTVRRLFKCLWSLTTSRVFAQQAQTQWMAFVTTCDVFYWSDYSRDPVVSPVIVPGTGSSTSSSSSGATINVPSTGNNAEGEGRRLLQNTCGMTYPCFACAHRWICRSRHRTPC